MSFATPADLETFLNKTFSTAEKAQAQMLLDGATSAIQVAVGQDIEQVEDDEVILFGNFGNTLTLPQIPCTSVSSVQIDGTTITADSGYVWDGSQTLYRGRRTSVVDSPWDYAPDPDLYWGGPQAQITVVYTHGFTDALMPAVVPMLCCTLAARARIDPGGNATSETTGPFSVTREGSIGSFVLTPDELRLAKKALGLR